MRRYRHILSIIDKCVQANSLVFESNIATTWNPKWQRVVNSISKLYATYCVCCGRVCCTRNGASSSSSSNGNAIKRRAYDGVSTVLDSEKLR